MSKNPLPLSNPRKKVPSAFDAKFNPQGWGVGPSDPGAGCWPNVDRAVPNLNGVRRIVRKMLRNATR